MVYNGPRQRPSPFPQSRRECRRHRGARLLLHHLAGVKTRLELEEFPQDDAGNAALSVAREAGALIKCIILRCSKTKAIFAHVVPCKGVDEDDYVTNLVIKSLEWLGHTAMILKADNERALQAFVSRVIRIATAKC